jgi:hypothetical protein
MQKRISKQNLALITAGLILAPDELGELCDSENHTRFLLSLGELVAEYCGGDIADAIPYSLPGAKREMNLMVVPNGCLPSLRNNVWSHFDTNQDWGSLSDGSEEWEDIEVGVTPSPDDIRNVLQAVLVRLGGAQQIAELTVY